jgi:hypothetical protein
MEQALPSEPASATSAISDERQKLVPAVVTVGAHGHIEGPAIIVRLPDGIEVELRDVAHIEPEEIGRLVAEIRRAR